MVTVLHYIYAQNFNSSSCFWRSRKYQGHLSPLSLWYTNVSNFGSLSWFWRWKEHTCPWSPYLGLWRMLCGVCYSYLDLVIVTGLWYTHILNYDLLSDFEGAKKITVLQVLISSVWGFWGSWLGFGILILIRIWSLVFGSPMFWFFVLHLYFESAKDIHVLLVLIWCFGGCWRFLLILI